MSQSVEHLLRTLAAVPIGSRILDLGCGLSGLVEALVRLGFDVYACDTNPGAVDEVRGALSEHLDPEQAAKRVVVSELAALGFPDDFFDWIAAVGVLERLESRDAMVDVLEEARRVLRPGGWIFVTAPALPEQIIDDSRRGYAGDSGLEPSFTSRTLDELLTEAGYVVAEPPSIQSQDGERVLQAIYRRVEPGTSL